MQMQLKLSGTGNNHLELAITIIQHLNQSRTRKINPNMRPTYHYRPEQTKKHHKFYRTTKSHINTATTMQK